MKACLNNTEVQLASVEALADFLAKIEVTENAEVWITSPSKTFICALKSGKSIFLMYLRYPTDSGFVSHSPSEQQEVLAFTMAN